MLCWRPTFAPSTWRWSLTLTRAYATFAGDETPRDLRKRNRVVGVILAAGATAMALVSPAAAAPGDISTVAGNGVQGYNGDGIAATAAELDRPPAAIARPDGDILIPDFGNNR